MIGGTKGEVWHIAVIAVPLGVFLLLPVKLTFATYLILIYRYAFISHHGHSTFYNKHFQLQNTAKPTQLTEYSLTPSRLIMRFSSLPKAAIGLAFLATPASAGLAGYGICQAGCAAVVTACYAAGGAIWGATPGATASSAIVGCNNAFGTCQAACAKVTS